MNAGAAYCWGRNALGNGTTQGSPVPVPVSGGLTFTMLATGDTHTCGLTGGGVAYCWGSDNYDQLGNGSGGASLTPGVVLGNATYTTIFGGKGSHLRGRHLRSGVLLGVQR